MELKEGSCSIRGTRGVKTHRASKPREDDGCDAKGLTGDQRGISLGLPKVGGAGE